MNILLISNGYPSKEITFASIFVKNHYEKLKELPDLNVDRHIIKRKNTSLVGSIAKYLWCFISFAAKIPQQYDIVHVHFLSPIYLLACIYKLRNPRCRIIVTFHGTDINELSHPIWRQFYRFLLDRKSTRLKSSNVA